MRTKLVLLFLCLSPLACSNDLALPGELQGTWAADFTLPGASLVLDITQADGPITGSGTYAIEAGRAGTLQVRGSYTPPGISLTIQRDFGLRQTYTGMVLDSRHMTGTMADSTGRVFALTFTRR